MKKIFAVLFSVFVTCSAVYADLLDDFKPAPRAAKELLDDIKAQNLPPENVKFRNVCSKDASKRAPNEICIEDFKDIQVQPLTAIGLSKELIRRRKNQEAVCSSDVRQRWLDDYIACTVVSTRVGASENDNIYYEFHFDDVFETNDIILRKDVRRGIGDIYYLQDPLDQIEYQNGKRLTDVFKIKGSRETIGKQLYQKCQILFGDTADRFAYNVKYYDAYTNRPVGARGTVTAHCKLEPKDEPPINSLPYLIDTSVFRTLQTKLSFDLEVMLAQYAVRQLYKHGQIQMEKFWCDYSSASYDNDDYLSCYIQIQNKYKKYTTVDGSSYNLPSNPWFYIDKKGKRTQNKDDSVSRAYRVDFLFNDLSDAGPLENISSNAALQCISKTDGVYDGANCVGLNQEQCTTLAQEGGISTRWDNDKGCILTSVDALNKLKFAGKVAATLYAGHIIVGLTIITGGSTLYIVVAVASTVVGTALTVASQVLTEVEKNRTDTFNQSMAMCTDAECVRQGLSQYIEHISGYVDDLREEEINAIDIIMEEKLRQIDFTEDENVILYNAFLNAKSKDTGHIFDCFGHDNDALKNTKCVFDTTALVLDFIPITNLLKKLPAKIPGLLTKAPKLLRFARTAGAFEAKMATLAKSAEKIQKVEKRLSDIKKATSGAAVLEKPLSASVKAKDLRDSVTAYMGGKG